MAKKKKVETGLIEAEMPQLIASDNVENMLAKTFGGVVQNSDYIMGQRKQIVSVSPAIDIALGGGIPEGSMVVLTGDPKIGKTVTALSFCANAQKQGRKIYFGNIEGRIKERDLLGIDGLKLDGESLKIITSTQQKILNGEDFLGIFDNIISAIPKSVSVIDSFSALCSKKEMENDFNDSEVAPIQKKLAKFCKKISNILPINNTIVIGITHQMANINPMARTSKIEKSGTALQYQTDVKLKALMMTHLYEGSKEDGKVIGQTVKWQVMTSAIGPPGMKFESHIKFGHGIWKEMELIDAAVEFGIVKKSGSWFEWDGDKVQGKGKLSAILECEPEKYEALKKEVYDILGFSYEV